MGAGGRTSNRVTGLLDGSGSNTNGAAHDDQDDILLA
jgi:hypothetical protein